MYRIFGVSLSLHICLTMVEASVNFLWSSCEALESQWKAPRKPFGWPKKVLGSPYTAFKKPWRSPFKALVKPMESPWSSQKHFETLTNNLESLVKALYSLKKHIGNLKEAYWKPLGKLLGAIHKVRAHPDGWGGGGRWGSEPMRTPMQK